jgi:adenosine/AMP kinase
MPTGMKNTARKTLMVGEAQHNKLNELANKFNVSQPDIIEALFNSVDEVRLQAAIAEAARNKRLSKAEANKKARLLEQATAQLSAGQLEALLAKLGVANPGL